VIAYDPVDTLDPEQLREALRVARAEMARKDEALRFKQALIDKLTHENAVLNRLKFAAKSEAYTVEQKSLLEETLDMDLAAVAAEIEALQPRAKPADEKKQPKRAPLPPRLPRREIPHEPENKGLFRRARRFEDSHADFPSRPPISRLAVRFPALAEHLALAPLAHPSLSQPLASPYF
jgi:Transposase C of IS166 homeodomain